ncbi:MAG: hypothetical protein V3U32_03560 [Anaerolineales bacterium]
MRLKLPVGMLICFAAAACSTNAGSEQEVAPLPTAKTVSTLPTAVPPEEGGPGQIGEWAIPFSYQIPEGTWGVGFHRYALHVDCPILAQAGLAGEWQDFVVTNDVTPINTPVYLRLGGLSISTLGPPDILTIHPDQLTIALVTIIGVTEEQAAVAAESDDCEIVIGWDGANAEELLPAEPYRP